MPAPVFEGDTSYAAADSGATRIEIPRDIANVNVRTRGFNQNGVVIVRFTRTLLVYRQAVARFVLGEGTSRAPLPAR